MRLGAAAFVFGLSLWASNARALDQNVLPAFALVAPSGAAVSSSELSTEAHWLLIYVSTSCGSCDRLLAALETWLPTLTQSRVIVVIRGTPEAARAYATKHTNAPGMTWYTDVEQQGSSALGLQHEPALVAIENGRVAWIVNGVLNDPSAVEPIVRNWTAR